MLSTSKIAMRLISGGRLIPVAWSTRTRRRHGSVTVEFAFIIPIMLVFIIGVFDISKAMILYEEVDNASHTIPLPSASILAVQPDGSTTLTSASGAAGHVCHLRRIADGPGRDRIRNAVGHDDVGDLPADPFDLHVKLHLCAECRLERALQRCQRDRLHFGQSATARTLLRNQSAPSGAHVEQC